MLTALTLGLLLPFLAKPLHIDDPIYVWIAQHLVDHPFDPFGFDVNWRGSSAPLHAFINNPPLASYFLVLPGLLAGWSERALHAASLLPALAAVWATWALARGFGASGLTAALLLCVAPGFVVSCTTLMADVPMLALWIWALACWDRGVRSGARSTLLAAALLAALCPLTKFPGLALLPLLVAHALLLRADWRRWAPFLLIPVAAFGAYHAWTTRLYGHALFLDPVEYTGMYQSGEALAVLGRVVAGLAFTGASAASLLAVSPLLLGARGWRRFGCAALGLAASMLLARGVFEAGFPSGTPLSPLLAVQLALWTTVGAASLVLAASDVRDTRSPEAMLLLLWVSGMLVFAAFINWSVSVRAVLPLLPAVAILAARRIERRAADAAGRGRRSARRRELWLGAGIAASALLSLAVARADARLAQSGRAAALELVTAYRGAGREIWFQGHWGFQYYAQQLGARPLERGERSPPGAVLLQPLNNSYAWPIADSLLERRSVAGPVWLGTMGAVVGAGFYSSTWGPLPFAFGAVPPEIYFVYASPASDAAPRAPLP
jgi:4-amino-4-deoxy-L-arabinose transferase-like glycosyltransferase